jgi:hypothetical protein
VNWSELPNTGESQMASVCVGDDETYGSVIVNFSMKKDMVPWNWNVRTRADVNVILEGILK